MSDSSPLISVVMITYQHEKYIAEAIKSVLAQTFKDFELIIVSDGSTDKTDEIINSFQDDQILYIYQENQGPSTAINNGIIASRGKYIALMSGDDVCYPQRLELQYQYLDNFDKKIVFSWVDFINDDSQPFIGEHFAQNYFNHPNRTRSEILNWFFMKGNYLCAVTALVEKEILLEAGLFNLASIQIQDFDMWAKLVKNYDIYIVEEKLVKYRIRSDSNNLSSHPSNSVRTLFEWHQTSKNILDNIPIELFKLAFSNQIRNDNFQIGYEYELEKAFLYLKHDLPLFQSIGTENLFRLMQKEEFLSIAKSKYSFNLIDLYKLTKNTDITNSEFIQQTQSELERLQAQLQESQSGLKQLQAQLQESQFGLKQLQAQLQESQFGLERLQAQLQESQSELARSQAQFQQPQSELARSQAQLQQSEQCLRAMESSKFWKLRNAWFKLKGLTIK